MSSIESTARRAGSAYLVMSILMVLGYMYFPSRFMVPGDAHATALRIMGSELIYRVSILNAAVAQLLFVFVAMALYDLFREVDRGLARLMVTLVCVGVAAELVNVAGKFVPLILLGGADYLSAFTRPQLEAMAFGSIRVGGALGQLLIAIWGLWLFPFGRLTIKSGYFPKWLGWLLYASGVAYLATFLANTLVPAQRGLVTQIATPFYFGELAMVLWLAIAGARMPAAPAREAVSRAS